MDSFIGWFKCYTLAPSDIRHARIVEHEIQAHLVPRGDTSLNVHRNKDKHRFVFLLSFNEANSFFLFMPKVAKFAENEIKTTSPSFQVLSTVLMVINNSSRLKWHCYKIITPCFLSVSNRIP